MQMWFGVTGKSPLQCSKQQKKKKHVFKHVFNQQHSDAIHTRHQKTLYHCLQPPHFTTEID